MRTPEQIKKYQKQWREKNRKKRADYAKVYHAAWYEKNKEKKLEQNKKWDKENKEKRKAISTKHRKKYPEKEINRTRKRRERYPEKVKAEYRKHSKTTKGYYTSYKAGAKRRGYDFELEFKDFVLIMESNCQYCDTPKAMGVDRVENEIGYLKSNCVPCCTHCNRMKWAHSKEFFFNHIEKIAKHNRMV